MLSINENQTTEYPAPFTVAETVAEIGDDCRYCVLTLRLLQDGQAELNCSYIAYDERTGRCDTDDVGTEIGTVSDELILCADDLMHAAGWRLDEEGVEVRRGEDFGEAVERWLDARERAVQYAVAAE